MEQQPRDFLMKSELTAEEFKAQAEQASKAAVMDIVAEKSKDKQQALEKKLSRAGIPERFRDKDFETFDKPGTALDVCKRFADNFQTVKTKGANLILTGQPGTGKTHLAVSILKQVMESGETGFFVTVSEMLRAIRGTYSAASKTTEQEVFDYFINASLLVLDEVGVAIGDDEKRKALIFDVLNGRYNRMKPTVIIGNLTPEEMEDYLGFRVWDRLMESNAPVIAFDWASYRRTNNKR